MPGSRAAYSTDSSNYRQVPIGVVVPRTVEAAVVAGVAVAACAWLNVAVLVLADGFSCRTQIIHSDTQAQRDIMVE